MIIIFNEKLNNKINIIHVNIINNILFIFYYHSKVNGNNYIYGSHIFDFYLKKVNLITGKNKEILLFSGDKKIIYINYLRVYNDKIYFFTNDYLYEYKINDIILKNNDLNKFITNINNNFNLPFNEFYSINYGTQINESTNNLLTDFVEDAKIIKNEKYNNIILLKEIIVKIHDIIIYNNVPYFLISNNKYLFVNYNGDILFEFADLNCNNNTVIKINTKIISAKIKCYKNYVLFFYGNVVIYNIPTREIIEFNNFNTILSDDKFVYLINDDYYVYDLNINKSNLLDNYLNDKMPIYDNYEPDKVIFKIDDCYLTFDNTTFNLILYLDKKINYIDDNAKLIKIGTNKEYVYLSLNHLLNSSELINNMYSNIDNITEIIHPSFENIRLYHDFVKDNKFNDLYNLFKICSLLIDKNLNLVGELIVEFIKYNDININESFKYLELLSTSICDFQFEKLFYVIMNKYNINDIKFIFNNMDKETKLYNFCINEMINFIFQN